MKTLKDFIYESLEKNNNVFILKLDNHNKEENKKLKEYKETLSKKYNAQIIDFYFDKNVELEDFTEPVNKNQSPLDALIDVATNGKGTEKSKDYILVCGECELATPDMLKALEDGFLNPMKNLNVFKCKSLKVILQGNDKMKLTDKLIKNSKSINI